MTTATIVPERTRASGIGGVLQSEWTKIRSVRSTYWTLGASILFSIGFGALAAGSVAHHYHQYSGAELHRQVIADNFDPVSQSMSGVILGQIALAVLGVLIISSEYRNRMIRTTLTAVPRRGRMLAAKVAVFGGLALLVGEFTAFVSFFIGMRFFDSQELSVSLGDPGVLRAVVGTGVYLALTGIIGLGLGLIIRHSAGAITAVIGFLLVLPILATALPLPWQDRIGQALPFSIGEQTSTTADLSGHLSPLMGLVVLALYAVAALAVGGWLLQRRDA
jgi:ABC-type transport system involved in multi-copper enzyme maturation permease subunit